MSGVMVVQMPEEALRQQVPKHALTLEEVVWALGGAKRLVMELREIGALVPAGRCGRLMLFDANAVARVWAEFRAGKYDGQLETWRSDNG